MPKLSKILVAAALLLAASGLYAQDSRFSIGVGVGKSFTDPDSKKATDNGGVTVIEEGGDFAWTLNVGYKLNDRWSIQGGYTDAGDSNVGGIVGNGLPYHITYFSSLWTIAPVWNIQFNDRLSVDLKAGPYMDRIIADARGFATTSGFSRKDFGIFAGVSLKVTFSPTVSMNVSYDYFPGDFKYRVITAGFRFGL